MEQIINGVDITNCPFKDGKLCKQAYYNEEFRKGDEMYILPCEDFSSCVYKQLRRKEEECESLKKELKHEEEMNIKLAKESIKVNGKLKQALDEIEKICQTPDLYRGRSALARYIQDIIQEVKGE